MSPMQIRCKALDALSEIYALGMVAFELLTGQLPVQGRNAQEMMIARLRGTPTRLRQLRAELPENLKKALAKAMETNPDSRFSTTMELADALAGNSAPGGGGGGLISKLFR